MKVLKIICLCLIIACGNQSPRPTIKTIFDEEIVNDEDQEEQFPETIKHELCKTRVAFCMKHFKEYVKYECIDDYTAVKKKECGKESLCYEEFADAYCESCAAILSSHKCLGDTWIEKQKEICRVVEYCYRKNKTCAQENYIGSCVEL